MEIGMSIIEILYTYIMHIYIYVNFYIIYLTKDKVCINIYIDYNENIQVRVGSKKLEMFRVDCF